MKTILIIPYRNRDSHLAYFLEKSFPKLKETIPNLEIIIVEQTEGKKFNRGATINIGFNYYNQDEYDYITQDVDVNPIIQEAVDFYKREVQCDCFLGIYSDGGTLGGVIKCKGSTFRKVNGFPNDYWGWGHEDKELQNRAEFFHCNVEKIIKFHEYERKKRYFQIFQDNHVREESGKWSTAYQQFKRNDVNIQKYNIMNNGLTTLKYTILEETQLQTDVKKIKVEIE
jgi:hypothetical protein